MITRFLLLSLVYAHSWIEELRLIDHDGHFTGPPGYMRAHESRSDPNFSDTQVTHLLPSNNALEARDPTTVGILPQDFMCRRSQRQREANPKHPRLQAPPGVWIALRYAENGHVSLPQNSQGKPANRGTVYVYGTSSSSENERFLDVVGGHRAQLLATQPFDDGRCHQINGGNISLHRQAQYPHHGNAGEPSELLCQNNLQLPQNLPANRPYTLYWVWDWPTAPGSDSNLPDGKTEIYTSCIDILVMSSQRPKRKRRRDQADYGNMAISGYLQPSGTARADLPFPPSVVQTSQTKVQERPAPSSMGLAEAESLVLAELGQRLLSKLAASSDGAASPIRVQTTRTIIVTETSYVVPTL